MKKIVIFLIIAISALFVSCTEDEYSSEPQQAMKAEFELDQSTITDKIAFNSDREMVFTLKLIHNYLPSDSIFLKAEFINTDDNDIVKIDFFDDGGVAAGSSDLVAKNNLWTGVVNSADFNYEGSYIFSAEAIVKSFDSDQEISLDSFTRDLTVKENSRPVIVSVEGLEADGTLESGFDQKNILVDVVDDDNDENGLNDSQQLYMELYDVDNVLLKTDTYDRENNFDEFKIKIDSTYAVGLTTELYKLRFYAEDTYSETSEIKELEDILIENKKPVLSQFVYPEEVVIPQEEQALSFVVSVNVNDPQGSLSSQDIAEVKLTMTINDTDFYFEMLDDGDMNNSGDFSIDDAVYSKAFKYDNTNSESEYPISVVAVDRAGNESEILAGKLIFVKESKSGIKIIKSKVNDADSNTAFSNPFN